MMKPPANESEWRRALQNCAKEPVHAPGAIQPQGALLCMDPEFRKVLQASANLLDYLGITAQDALAMSPAEIFSRTQLRNFQEAVGDERQRTASTLVVARKVEGRRKYLHTTIYRSGPCVIVELEPEAGRGIRRLLASLNDRIVAISAATEPNTVLDLLARSARELSGYERAVVYAFDEEWHGHVLAEDRVAKASSFRGHRFPAGDIPAQVRRLYLTNAVRTIPDAQAAPVSLVPATNPLMTQPLDLSLGVLRAVSPVHLEYLHNMGVSASTSIAIISEKGLWGLLSLHGFTSKAMQPSIRSSLQLLVQVASQRLFLLQAEEEEAFVQEVRRSRDLLSEERGRLPELSELLERHGKQWCRLFKSCGVALVNHDGVTSIGKVPDRSSMDLLLGWLRQEAAGERAWCTDMLVRHIPSELVETIRGCCGLLALSLMDNILGTGWLLLFREERRVTHLWAGRERGRIEKRDGQLTLSPRRSFEVWREEIRDRSEPWTEAELRAGGELGEDLAVLVSALEISHLRDEAERQSVALVEANRSLEAIAHTDMLTDVWNRRRVEEAIDAEVAIAEREGRDFAILLFDVDYFKRVNDTYGHDVGDEVLAGLARLVNDERRGGDMLGRWGGEEFVFTASGTDLDHAISVAERLRHRVEDTRFGEAGQVTISVGVTAWRPGDTRDVLIKRADEAMYNAKRSGRNRVCVR